MEHFLAMLRMFTLWTPSVREISMAASISSCREVTFLFMLIPVSYTHLEGGHPVIIAGNGGLGKTSLMMHAAVQWTSSGGVAVWLSLSNKDIITEQKAAAFFNHLIAVSYTHLDVYKRQDKKLVLPKTAKGKPKKLNFTATQSFRPVNVYFACEGSYIMIANYTTQKTFYFEDIKNDVTAPVLENWLKNWIEETAQDDLEDCLLYTSRCV